MCLCVLQFTAHCSCLFFYLWICAKYAQHEEFWQVALLHSEYIWLFSLFSLRLFVRIQNEKREHEHMVQSMSISTHVRLWIYYYHFSVSPSRAGVCAVRVCVCVGRRKSSLKSPSCFPPCSRAQTTTTTIIMIMNREKRIYLFLQRANSVGLLLTCGFVHSTD